MLLEKIIHFDDLAEYAEIPQYSVKEIVIDSRIAVKETVFVCLRGSFSDGHNYALKAYLNGCRCFVAEKYLHDLPADAIVLVVKNTREILAKMACRFYDNPSRKLKIIGLTGTKGKTTTALMITHIMNSCGFNCGYIGSNGVYFNKSWYKTQNTTSNQSIRLLSALSIAAAMAKPKAKHIIKGAEHALSSHWFHEEYWQVVDNFLDKYLYGVKA